MGKETSPIKLELSSDSELNELLYTNLELIGGYSLRKIAKAMQRFNGPVHVHQDDGSVKIEKNWDWKLMLKEIPEYVAATKDAGLTPEQTEDLLIHSLNATPYDFVRVEINTSLLTRLFKAEAERNNKVTPSDFEQIKKMLTLCGKYGVIPGSIYSLTIARKAGLSVKEAAKLIVHHPNEEGHMAGYSLPHFFEALSPLSIANVDPKIITEVFKLAAGKRPYYRGHIYAALEDILIFGGPTRELTSEEILKSLLAKRKDDEDFEKTLERFIRDSKMELPDNKSVVIKNPKQIKEKYFIDKPGEIELHGLPYRTKRSLKDGVCDLEKIAKHVSNKWESVGEGSWTFDPKTATWYSMGGKLEIGEGKVRHNFVSFDISTLSRTPYLFHVHPQDLEVFLTNPYEDFPDREHRGHFTKFLSSTPSRADYSLVAELMETTASKVPTRSFIVHSLGLTEFVYPNDIEKIKEMAIKSRDIRDQVSLDFNWNEAIGSDLLDQIKDALDRRETKFSPKIMNKEKLVRQLIAELNKVLPKGFKLILHERGKFNI